MESIAIQDVFARLQERKPPEQQAQKNMKKTRLRFACPLLRRSHSSQTGYAPPAGQAATTATTTTTTKVLQGPRRATHSLTAASSRTAARRYHAQSVDSAPRASGKIQEESWPPSAVAARSVAGGTSGVRTTLQCVPFLAMCWTAWRYKAHITVGRGEGGIAHGRLALQAKDPHNHTHTNTHINDELRGMHHGWKGGWRGDRCSRPSSLFGPQRKTPTITHTHTQQDEG